ncbi:pyruvate,water dikinase [Crossiella equi]|uniref:Pyruvate,water dikinase n=1 Tax=Crossiella equi TaxID=130796 RepID=A0ABS5ARH2_9PSEU|nr:PEP/pyruvate-binding domain-containing protein [Crossiella equi]MBP2479156.1 pyruvate,water dikinase [Crossiella equi]
MTAVPHILTGRALLDESEVGRKFARQADMAAAGLPVPRFFCLPASLFTTVLAAHRDEVDRVLDKLDTTDATSLAEGSALLRRIVHEAAVPPDALAALYREFDRSFGAEAMVSVRSSMISEDSATDAFAGISESLLYVTRDRLLDAVRRCWASGFGTQALLYRAARGDGLAEVEVGVGVQRMAFGQRSFVLFTCDPITGSRDRVIAAGLGIGEGVVQEKVPLDHHFAPRDGQPVRTVTAHKDLRMDLDPVRPAAGPVLLPVRADEREAPALSPGQVQEVLALGDRVERLFGPGQDIEGTFTTDGKLHVLQARPVVLDLARQRLWSNANITESYPGTTTALTYTFAQRFYREDFRDFYRKLGVPMSTVDRHEDDLRGMLGLLHGRVYYSLSTWYRLHRLSETFPLWRHSFQRMMGMSPSVHDLHPDPVRSRRALPGALRLLSLWRRHVPSARRFGRWWDRTIGAHRAKLEGADPLELTHLMRSLWTEVGEQWGYTLVNDVLLQLAESGAMALLARWVPRADTGLHSDLLCGGGGNRSTDILLSLVGIAEQVREDKKLLAALAAEPVEQVWARLARGEFGTELPRRILAHAQQHGDRGLQELKLEVRTPREQPWQLLRLAGDYAKGELTERELRRREAQTRRTAEAELAKHLAGQPVRRAVLRFLLDKQRKYIDIRENTRYARAEIYGFGRAVFRRLGADLAGRGLLDSPDDVVHLTHDEILSFYDGTGVTRDLLALSRLRRAEHAAGGPLLPMNFATVGVVPDQLPGEETHGDADGPLRGLGSSSGRVRGTARVVVDPHQPLPPTEDLVLVARETDPGWLFLMLSAKGIVVERGTLLSHTAITGRKFRIPTVVAVPGATTAIADGAQVELDGAAGTVTILAETAHEH